MKGYIRVDDLGKAYKIYPSRASRLVEMAALGRIRTHALRWVFRHLTFEIQPGESVAVVGQNGAGKSTLLKLITGTSWLTEGHIRVEGRVSSLLELGMGFHPEFTGRQNVGVTAQFLGLSNAEVTARLPDIEAFAEIGEYFDQPLRTYSSGMQMRLAFSVATCMRPDVLIVDEALSVGDMYFSSKCMRRIRELQDQGTTLLFVSHDASAVKKLCDRALLLQDGALAMDDRPLVVMDTYNAVIAKRQGYEISIREFPEAPPATGAEVAEPQPSAKQVVSGTGEATVTRIQFHDVQGNPLASFQCGQRVRLDVFVKARADLPRLVLGVLFRDRLGHEMFGTNTFYQDAILEHVKAGERFRFRFELTLNLGAGNYSMGTMLVSSNTHLEHNYEWRDDAFLFTVVNRYDNYFLGSAYFPVRASVDRLAAEGS